MPFVLVGLGDMAWVVIAFLLAVAIGLFTNFLVQLIPDVPVIGSAIRNGVSSAGDAAGAWLIGQTKSAWSRLVDLLTDLGYADKWLWTRINGAVLHGFQEIDHVTTTFIPDQIAATARSLQNNINGVAADLSSDWDQLTNHTIPAAISTAESYADNKVTALANTVTSDFNTVESDLKIAETNLQNNINALSTDVTNDMISVWNAIDPLQTAVSTTIPNDIAQQAQIAKTDTDQAAATAQANLVTATNNLQANLNAVNSQLSSTIAANQAASNALAQADLNTAEGVAQADAAQARLAATNAAAAQLQATATTLQGSIDQNTQQIDTLQATTTITTQPLPGLTVPGTISVPLAVGALATYAVSIAQEFDDCAITTCGGPNNWQNLLSTALGVADFAALAAFLSEAVNNPAGAAKEFEGAASGLYSSGHALIDGLLSL